MGDASCSSKSWRSLDFAPPRPLYRTQRSSSVPAPSPTPTPTPSPASVKVSRMVPVPSCMTAAEPIRSHTLAMTDTPGLVYLSHRPIVLAIHRECVLLPKAHFGHPSGLLGASFFLNFAWNHSTVTTSFLYHSYSRKAYFHTLTLLKIFGDFFVALIGSETQVKM